MSFFPAAREALLDGRTVRAAPLLFLDFLGAPSRYWLGPGPLLTSDGNRWDGLDKVGRIDGLAYALGPSAPKAVLTIAALDAAIVGLAQSQATSVKNRTATVYWQLFDGNWQVLDAPYALWSGVMDTLSYRMADGDGAAGDVAGKVYSVSVAIESAWSGRNRPAAGFYDPQDQAARGYPGDTGLNQIPGLQGMTIVWKPT